MPIATYFFDFQSALGITAWFHLSSNLVKIGLFRKGFDKKLLLSMGIPAVLFVTAGAYLSKFISGNTLEIALAVFLITISLMLLVFKRVQIRPNLVNSVSGGVLSGLVAGLIGTGGAIRGIVLASFSLPVDVFIATSALIDLGIDASRSIVYYTNGYMHRHDMYLILILPAISFIGTYLGKKILNHISEERFKSLVLSLVLLTGMVTLAKILWMNV